MLELYIKIQNGLPVDHPHLKDNVLDAYELSDTDLDGHPDWLPFIRTEMPKVGIYEVADGPYYVRDGNVVNEQWVVRAMTDEEKVMKQNRRKFDWKNSGGPSNWVFDEAKCAYLPPVPYPDDGAPYVWVQEANRWIEIDEGHPTIARPASAAANLAARPPYPNFGKGIEHPDHDGIVYEFDEEAWEWVPMATPAQPFPSAEPLAHLMVYDDTAKTWSVPPDAIVNFSNINNI
jgi:hypothetical protein